MSETPSAPGPASASNPDPTSSPARPPDDAAETEPPPGLSPKLTPLFTEAADIADRSPASACALLRLLLRSLIAATGIRSRHLVRDIEKLVSDGAPMGLMRALDVLSLSDTEARRPGELNLANGHRDVQNLMLLIHLFVRHVTTADPANSEPGPPEQGQP